MGYVHSYQNDNQVSETSSIESDSSESYCTALVGLYFKNWPETIMKITNLVRLRNYGYVLDLVFFEQTKCFFEGRFEYSVFTQWTKHPNSSLIQKFDFRSTKKL